jgi:hypothetical protein
MRMKAVAKANHRNWQKIGSRRRVSVFVFLNLLERQSERLAQRFLGQPQHFSPHPQPISDMLVDSRIGILGHVHAQRSGGASGQQPVKLAPGRSLAVPYSSNHPMPA